MTSFFSAAPKQKPKKKRGRPSKSKQNRGRPKKNASPPTPPRHLRKSPPEIAAANAIAEKEDKDVDNEEDVEEDVEEEEEEDGAPKKKKSRINWGAEPHRAKMENAINDWIKKEGDAVDSNGRRILRNMNYCFPLQGPRQLQLWQKHLQLQLLRMK